MTDQLERIVTVAGHLRAARLNLERLQADTAAAQALCTRLEREDLPALMLEAGLTELRLTSGELIQLCSDVDARISKASAAAAHAWLDENGFGGLIKTSIRISFPRSERSEATVAAEQLASLYGEEAVVLDSLVHPATLKAFVKERMREGSPVPMDTFGVYPFHRINIK